jgi:hypothetical protein
MVAAVARLVSRCRTTLRRVASDSTGSKPSKHDDDEAAFPAASAASLGIDEARSSGSSAIAKSACRDAAKSGAENGALLPLLDTTRLPSSSSPMSPWLPLLL